MFDVGCDAARLERVERREQRDDRRLVVGRGARVDPLVGLEGRARREVRRAPRAPSSIRPSRRIGVNGVGCFHSFGLTGWPS